MMMIKESENKGEGILSSAVSLPLFNLSGLLRSLLIGGSQLCALVKIKILFYLVSSSAHNEETTQNISI